MIGFRGMGIARAVGAAILVVAAVPAMSSVSRVPWGMERQVLVALNDMRTEPDAHVGDLELYRRHLKGRIVTMPGTSVTYRTAEGAAPVSEAVAFLGKVGNRTPLAPDDVLAAAAADHVAQQAASGMTGHYSADGSDPGARVMRHGGGRMVTEVIAYGAFDAADVIRQLVIDDGVPGRGHRTAVFARHLRYAGVACGPHPKYRTMCVIDMADTPGGQLDDFSRMRIASAR